MALFFNRRSARTGRAKEEKNSARREPKQALRPGPLTESPSLKLDGEAKCITIAMQCNTVRYSRQINHLCLKQACLHICAAQQ